MKPYYSQFGMTTDPFTRGRRAGSIIATEEHRETLFRLDYLKTTHGFGLLTGESGCGKTTALRSWASTLPASSYKVIYVPLTTLSTSEFYREMVQEMGLEPAFRKVDNFRLLQQEIRSLSEEKSVTPVFIIDEASDLSTGMLNDLKIIFNFDMDSRNKAIIVLAGLPTLNHIMRLTRNEPLLQRIVMNYTIEPLSEAEGIEYILKKLESAKGTPDLFTKDALTAVTGAARGVPRVIDQICTRALILAEQSNEQYINSELVRCAVEDIKLR